MFFRKTFALLRRIAMTIAKVNAKLNALATQLQVVDDLVPDAPPAP